MSPRAGEPRWPDLFVLGVAKAGTTSLASYLGRHPEIFMSPFKEPHYFSRVRPESKLRHHYTRIRRPEQYLALFRGARGERWIGEASTSYFWDGEALDRIEAISPRARHLVILRHPVERAYSHYLNDVREGIERRSFEQAVDDELALAGRPQAWGVDALYLDTGLYARRLEHALDLFGEGRLRVLVFEELLATPREHLARVFGFLEIDRAPADSIPLEVHNPYARPRGTFARSLLGSGLARRLGRILLPSAGRQRVRRLLLKRDRKPPMELGTRARLADHYRADVEACERILGRGLPWRLDPPAAGGGR